MSVSTPAALGSEETYGLGFGRGDLEVHVIATLRRWIIPYLADYERLHGIRPRQLPVPPTPESIHGGVDFETFAGELLPELIVVCQPTGTAERYGDGTYGSWYTVDVAAIVSVEGEQDETRTLADAYGTALQKLIPEQGAFGFQADGVTAFATRTRLESAYGLAFVDDTVRDILRATVVAETFVINIATDNMGPRVPPTDPYAVPIPLPVATRVEVDLIRGTPDTTGFVAADGVVLDGTVNPSVVEYVEKVVDKPADVIPEPSE